MCSPKKPRTAEKSAEGDPFSLCSWRVEAEVQCPVVHMSERQERATALLLETWEAGIRPTVAPSGPAGEWVSLSSLWSLPL